MKYFYCAECDKYERVSDSTSYMTHEHPALGRGHTTVIHNYALQAIASPNHYGRATPALTDEEILGYRPRYEISRKDFEAKLEKLEFLSGKHYIVLYDPRSINEEYLSKLPPRKDIDVMFVPCMFDLHEDFVSETIALDNLDVIEEWVKERKAHVLRNLRMQSTNSNPRT